MQEKIEGDSEPRPERGAMRPYVPGGHAMDKSVIMSAFPFAGTTVSSALYPQPHSAASK